MHAAAGLIAPVLSAIIALVTRRLSGGSPLYCDLRVHPLMLPCLPLPHHAAHVPALLLPQIADVGIALLYIPGSPCQFTISYLLKSIPSP